MKILHVIRTPLDGLPVELACHQQGTHEVGVLLVQDGVYADPAAGQVSVYALRADLEARGLAADDKRHVPQPVEDIVDVWKEVGYSDAENYEPEAMGVVSRGEG